MILTFYISTSPILAFDVDLEAKSAQLLTPQDTMTEFIASRIVPVNRRTYKGLEEQLNFFMATKKTFPELIDQIKTRGFSADMHPNLRIGLDD